MSKTYKLDQIPIWFLDWCATSHWSRNQQKLHVKTCNFCWFLDHVWFFLIWFYVILKLSVPSVHALKGIPEASKLQFWLTVCAFILWKLMDQVVRKVSEKTYVSKLFPDQWCHASTTMPLMISWKHWMIQPIVESAQWICNSVDFCREVLLNK